MQTKIISYILNNISVSHIVYFIFLTQCKNTFRLLSSDAGLKYIFLVGGFAESPMLQLELRNAFSGVAKILVPSEAGLTILKGKQSLSLDASTK